MAKNRQGCSVLVPVDWNKSSFLAVEKEREVNYKTTRNTHKASMKVSN